MTQRQCKSCLDRPSPTPEYTGLLMPGRRRQADQSNGKSVNSFINRSKLVTAISQEILAALRSLALLLECRPTRGAFNDRLMTIQ